MNARDIPMDEEVLVKKDVFGYRIVHPIKRTDGTINWANLLFGGWNNLLILALFILLVAFFMYSYSNDMKEMKEYYSNNTCLSYSSIIETPTGIRYADPSILLNNSEVTNDG